MIKDFKSFINESTNYIDAVEMDKETFYSFLDDTYGEYVYPSTPYMGYAPEKKPEWIQNNFKPNEANISLHPENGKTSTSDEIDNTLYFITNKIFLKVLNVSDKEYDDIYKKYIFPFDLDNISSPIHDTYEEE